MANHALLESKEQFSKCDVLKSFRIVETETLIRLDYPEKQNLRIIMGVISTDCETI